MIALLRSEILRFRSRSLVAAVVVGGALMIVASVSIAALFSEKPDPMALRMAREELDHCPDDLRPAITEPAGDGVNVDYSTAWWGSCFSPFRSAEIGPGAVLSIGYLPMVLLSMSPIFAAVGVYFGASLVGADWHHRSMTTLLTWESRRGRVYVARMATVIVGTFLVVLALEAFGGVSLAIGSWLRGSLFGADGFWLRTSVEAALKVATIAAVAAAISASLAMMFRSTGAALGLLIAYFGYEQMLQAIGPTAHFWVLGRSVVVFLAPFDDVARSTGLDFKAAAAALAMYTTALLVVGFFVFERRDVS